MGTDLVLGGSVVDSVGDSVGGPSRWASVVAWMRVVRRMMRVVGMKVAVIVVVSKELHPALGLCVCVGRTRAVSECIRLC